MKIPTEVLRLHKQGWAVHWLRPRSKIPVESGWSKGPRDDLEKLIAKYRPGFNPGVRLGAASKIGDGYLAVLDVDVKSREPKHFHEAIDTLRALYPQTKNAPYLLSGRGGGSSHFYVRLKEPVSGDEVKARSDEIVKVLTPSVSPSKAEREKLSKDELMAGVRLRPAWEIQLLSEGRQAAMVDAIHPDTEKKYIWGKAVNGSGEDIPFIDPEEKAPLKGVNPWRDTRGEKGNGKVPRDRKPSKTLEIEDVDIETLDLRNEHLRAIVDGTGVLDRSAEVYSLCMTMLVKGISEPIIRGIFTRKDYYLGQMAFDHAKTNSRQKAALWLEKYCLTKARIKTKKDMNHDSVFEVEEQHQPSTNGAEVLSYKTFSQLDHPKPILTRVDGLLAERGLSLIYGASNSGKTFFALHLAYCLAADRKFFGWRVKPCSVVYVAAESPSSVEARLYAIKEFDWAGNIPLAVITESVTLFSNEKSLNALITTIKKIFDDFSENAGFVIIDTLACAAGHADENSATEMGQILASCRQIEAKTASHVTLVHHSGKDATKGPRGSSALLAAVDTAILVEDMTASVTKQRDGVRDLKVSFDLDFISVGKFEESTRLPVLKELGEIKQLPNLTRSPAQWLEVLKTLTTAGKPSTMGAWRAAYQAKFPQKGKSTVSEGIKKACEKLSKAGLIKVEGELVSIL